MEDERQERHGGEERGRVVRLPRVLAEGVWVVTDRVPFMSPDESESPADTDAGAANQSSGLGYTGIRVSPTSFSPRLQTVKTRCAAASSYLEA